MFIGGFEGLGLGSATRNVAHHTPTSLVVACLPRDGVGLGSGGVRRPELGPALAALAALPSQATHAPHVPKYASVPTGVGSGSGSAGGLAEYATALRQTNPVPCGTCVVRLGVRAKVGKQHCTHVRYAKCCHRAGRLLLACCLRRYRSALCKAVKQTPSRQASLAPLFPHGLLCRRRVKRVHKSRRL